MAVREPLTRILHRTVQAPFSRETIDYTPISTSTNRTMRPKTYFKLTNWILVTISFVFDVSVSILILLNLTENPTKTSKKKVF